MRARTEQHTYYNLGDFRLLFFAQNAGIPVNDAEGLVAGFFIPDDYLSIETNKTAYSAK